MYKNKKIIVTICARGGSQGVKNKNSKLLAGKPLIAYSLEQALALPWADRIIVSTDGLQLKKIAESYGIEVPFMRPTPLASNTAAKVPAIIHAVKTAQKYFAETYDIDVDLDVTCPLRTIEDITQTLDMLLEKPDTKSVYSVYQAPRNPYFNLVEPDQQGYVHLSKTLTRPVVRRQDSPVVYAMNSSIYAMWVKDLFAQKTYHTDKTRVFIMPPERSIDIDSELDFEIVEFLLKKRI